MGSNIKYLNGNCFAQIIAVVAALSCIACQPIQGIYHKNSDFDKNIIKFQRTKEKKTKLYINEYKAHLKIKYGDSIHVIQKDSVYGYRDQDGNEFRLFKGKIFHILNKGEKIILYKAQKNEGTPKNPQMRVSYFFSKDSSSPVFYLTKRNLNSNFNENKRFQELIEIHFRKENDLINYDNYNNMYKINSLLQLSINPKSHEIENSQ